MNEITAVYKEEERGNSINSSEAEFAKISIDSCGHVFKWNGGFFRAIHVDMVEEVRTMFSCGMIQKLVEESLFPRSWITEYSISGYGMVIGHELIPNISYPFEWSFEMLKDAAITVLKTNFIARKYGYQTKDCHTYNICFYKTEPLFVDLGSFIRVDKNEEWASYQDFLRSYYYPLRIWSHGNSHIARKLLFSLSLLETMPHESYLLYKYPFMRGISHNLLRLAIASYFRFRNLIPSKLFSFERLIDKTSALSLKKDKSQWGDYHDTYYDANGEPLSNRRFDRIIELVKDHEICSVVELGGNQGLFSEMLTKSTPVQNVVCTDFDEMAVDYMYTNAKRKGLSFSTAIVDIMYPLMNYYESPPFIRFKSDAVFALAVSHHLILGNYLPVDLFLEIVAKYSRKYVFIEFMPLGLWDGKTAPPLPVWYTQDWFKASFEKVFKLNLIEKLDENRVLFFGEVTH